MKKLIRICAVLVLLGAAPVKVRADFVLTGTDHLDVTTRHVTGVLFDYSTAHVLQDGYIQTAYVNDWAELRLFSGGSVGGLEAYASSAVDISGGSMDSLSAYAFSAVGISGGNVHELYAYDFSAVYISSASVGWLKAYNYSAVGVSGGSMSGIYAYDSSAVGVSGGNRTILAAYDSSAVDISGGNVGELAAYDSSAVDISGGSISKLYAFASSQTTIYGYDFRATGGLVLDGDRVLGTGVLTGKWFDGTAWVLNINGNQATAIIRVVLQPPASWQGKCGDPLHPILASDLNRDCYVDFLDLALFCQQWLVCTHPDCD